MPDSPLTLNFPASLDTVVSGGEVANRAFTTLSNTITDTALSIPLTDSTVFPSTGVITLTDSLTAPTKTEDIIYTANAANTLTVPTGGRGAFGSTAQNWSGTVYVRMRMMAEHHEFNRDAIIALETKLGYSASTPTNGKFLVGSTTAGTSVWRVLAAGDIPDLSASYEPANANIQAHIASTSNPHSVTKSQVGLGSVENTALSTWAGSTNLTTLGTVIAGTWNGAVIGASYGGAGSINGILKADGLGMVSAAVSGTDYLSATAPGSSGNLLYNNAGAYSATTGITYGASSGETLAVHNQTSDQYTLSARQNSTSSATPLVSGFSAMLGLYVLNGASQYSIAYINNAAGKIANYQIDSNDLEFDYYQIDDTYQGGNYLLSAGGLAFNSTNSDYAWIASVDDADVFGLGHGYSPSQVFDLTWGSRGITFRAPASAIADGSIAASHMHFYLDEAADALKVKWKESGGTVFNRTIANLDQSQTFTNKTLTASSNALGGVTMAIGSDADGDMYYRSSNVLTRLPKGTALQVLRMNAGATAPEWAASGSGLTVGTSTITSGTATRLLYETSGNVLGEISGATSDGTNVTFGSGNLIATSAALTTPAITTSATVTRNSLGTTTATGLELKNTTAAAAGAQQVSPATVWTAEGWKTNATAGTQTVNFQAYVLPVQGAANPTATWVLQSQINGGGYTNRLTLASDGTLTVGNLSFNGSNNRLTVASGSIYSSGGPFIAPAQSAAGPSFQDASSGQYGMFFPSSGTAFAVAAVEQFRLTANAARLGPPNAAAPAAQTLSVQSVVAGTSNTAGANWTFKASAGTGSAAGGSFIWQVAPAGSSGTSQNTFFTAMTLAADKTLTFGDAVNLVMDTTTGTKIGTATGQKIGFWNATPVVQQILATGAGATVDNVISLLQTLGLCKQS